jgi:hypothetical protein
LIEPSISRFEDRERFGMSEVQAPSSGDEELAADGRFRIKYGYRSTAGGSDFRRAQTGGAAADYGNVHGNSGIRMET